MNFHQHCFPTKVIKKEKTPTLRSAIKKAINDYSKKYKCVKVWAIEITDPQTLMPEGTKFMTIEIQIKKKKNVQSKN